MAVDELYKNFVYSAECVALDNLEINMEVRTILKGEIDTREITGFPMENMFLALLSAQTGHYGHVRWK